MIMSKPNVVELLLTSGEQVGISLGVTTAKVFAPGRSGIASGTFVQWEHNYFRLDTDDRNVTRGMVMLGLIDLVSRAGSIAGIQPLWDSVNPIDVGMKHYATALAQEHSPDGREAAAQINALLAALTSNDAPHNMNQSK